MTSIYKIILSVTALLAVTDITIAQTYSNVPDDTINMVGMMEDLETLSIEQINNTSNTIQLKWVKVSEIVPAAWEASACDNAICYTSLVDSGMMMPINAGDYGFLLMHITPHVNSGTAVIRYAVWDISIPALRDTLTFILTVNTTDISETESKKRISVFPNPANENINVLSNLPKGFQYVITDVSGKEVKKGVSTTSSVLISTTNFSDDLYNITILSEGVMINTKKFLVRR